MCREPNPYEHPWREKVTLPTLKAAKKKSVKAFGE
jgi:hypothetical protein